MPTFSREQIASALIRAGLPPDQVDTGIGIVFAESGARSEAVNDTPGVEYSVGPWQINLLAHPGVTSECASDLGCSTNYAVSLWQQQGWSPWTTYLTGAYKKFLGGSDVGPIGGGYVPNMPLPKLPTPTPGTGSGGISLPGVGDLVKGSILDPASWATFGWELLASLVAVGLILYGLTKLVGGAVPGPAGKILEK